ncbi:MAG: YncE family protein [Halomonas sp.]|nr:YncE family protein [Halomonas sp.]MDN6298043.1 YncE family protein [Halomonas sp.]MDN6314551.1 YncE family protein [Halomonas sp.]
MSLTHALRFNTLPTQRPVLTRRLFSVSLLAASIGVVSQASAAPGVDHSVKVDESVYEIAFNGDNDTLYAAVTGSRKAADKDSGEKAVKPGIVALDAETLDEVDKILTGDVIPFGIAINHATQTLYAADTKNGQVGVYDIDSGEELALIENPGEASGHLRQIVIDEDSNTIYVSAFGGVSRGDEPAPKSAVWVIDGDTNTLKDTIMNPVQSAAGLALDAANQRLYVADLAASEIAEIDLKSKNHEVLRTFSAVELNENDPDAKPEKFDTINLELDVDNGILYAINQKTGGVSIINVESGEIETTVSTGDGALSARLHPQSGDLYVANRGDGTVSIIDADSRYVTAHLGTGTHPQTIAIDPKTGNVYVSNKAKGKDRHGPEDAPTPVEPGGNTVTLITP